VVTATVHIHVGDAVWSWVSVAAIAAAVLLGIPSLTGGRRRGRGRGRGRGGGYRVRVGPSLPVVLAAALIRRADTLLLVAASAAFVVFVALNATG
jgi:hypothetical protein